MYSYLQRHGREHVPANEDLPSCSCQLRVFGISGPVCPSDPGIGATALDKGRAILMNTIQGTKSTPKTVETVPQSFAGAAPNAAKQPVLSMLQAAHVDEDVADRCRISGSGLTDSELAAPADQKNRTDQVPYLSKMPPPPPKTAYNDEDYELCTYKEDDPLSSARLVCEPWQI
ncbi:Serine/threonine protein kinase [Giardia duodenalis]|uniref:Serine/threonine protein kinase n=1 Tax=Giardia intestinalis TaxID=5741 RepID=V6TPW9_GIAIN|nr:Serine/threonine protein kinase [Giardia intestinalis]